MIPFYSRYPTVRAVAGPELDRLTAESERRLFRDAFVVGPESDRMGYRLAAEPLNLLGDEQQQLVSSAVDFGTVQLLPDGRLIVLMADHQTTGGYPRVLQIVPNDLPLAAQLGAHDKIGFHLVSLAEAENLSLALKNELNLLRHASKFRW